MLAPAYLTTKKKWINENETFFIHDKYCPVMVWFHLMEPNWPSLKTGYPLNLAMGKKACVALYFFLGRALVEDIFLYGLDCLGWGLKNNTVR